MGAWQLIGRSLLFNRALFNKTGIRAYAVSNEYVSRASEERFLLSDKIFSLTTSPTSAIVRAIELQNRLLFPNTKKEKDSPDLQKDTDKEKDSPDLQKDTEKKAKKDNLHSQKQPAILPETVIYNSQRREEVYLRTVLDCSKTSLKNSAEPFWSNLWLSHGNAKNFHFSGFDSFVMAGCLIGAELKAVDQNGAAWSFIKHYHELTNDPDGAQKICKLDYVQEEESLYERGLFLELEKTACLIKTLSAKNQNPPRLVYHSPYYDYILFGIALFARGRITLMALDKLIEYVEAKKAHHVHEIRKIFGPAIEIASPFDALFAPLKDLKVKDMPYTPPASPADSSPPETKTCAMNHFLTEQPSVTSEDILKTLGLPILLEKAKQIREKKMALETKLEKTLGRNHLKFDDHLIAELFALENEINPALDAHYEKQANSKRKKEIISDEERSLVTHCLERLTGSGEQQAIWQDLAESQPANGLEDLLKLGNTFMIAKETCRYDPHRVCSIQNSNEKQIQLGYASFSKKCPDKYPADFNVTHFPHFLGYSLDSLGRAFYFVTKNVERLIESLFWNPPAKAEATQNKEKAAETVEHPQASQACFPEQIKTPKNTKAAQASSRFSIFHPPASPSTAAALQDCNKQTLQAAKKKPAIQRDISARA